MTILAVSIDHHQWGSFSWGCLNCGAGKSWAIVLFVSKLALSTPSIDRIIRGVDLRGAFLTLGVNFASDSIELFAFSLVPFQLDFQIFTPGVILTIWGVLRHSCFGCIIWFPRGKVIISVLICLISPETHMRTSNPIILLILLTTRSSSILAGFLISDSNWRLLILLRRWVVCRLLSIVFICTAHKLRFIRWCLCCRLLLLWLSRWHLIAWFTRDAWRTAVAELWWVVILL